jgi:type I restriction enzyme S subunit
MTQILNDVCTLIVDCEHKTAPTQSKGIPSIRTPNIGRSRLILDNVNRVSDETYKAWTKRAIPQTDDLILAREAPIGNVAIILSNQKVCLGQRTVLIRPDTNQVDSQYICYLLLGDEIQGKIISLSNGATLNHLNMRDIRNLELPELPFLPTQRKIAAILSAYDDLIENNTWRIKILEEMAQALYREWFVKFRFPGHEKVKMVESELGMVPVGWEVKCLSDVCNIVMGQSPKSEFYNDIGEGLPFHQGVTDFGDRFPTDRKYCTVMNRIAEAGDILFSVRAPVGRINISDKKIVIGRGLCAIRSNSSKQTYVLQQLKEQFMEEDTMGGGTIFKSVTKTDVHGIKLLVPSEVLLKSFEEIMIPIFTELKNLTFKNVNLRHTRDLLLPKLISGKIEVDNLDIELGGFYHE